MASAKVPSRVGESRKQPASALNGKTATFDMQGAALGDHDTSEGVAEGGVLGARGGEQSEATAHHGGQAPLSSNTAEWVVLTADDRKVLKELKRIKKNQRKSKAHQAWVRTMGARGGNDAKERSARHLKSLSRSMCI